MPILNGEKVEFSFRITAARIAAFFAVMIIAFSALESGSEDYVVSAYYPVPYGGFQRLTVGRKLLVFTNYSADTSVSAGPTISLTWPDANNVYLYGSTGTGYFKGGFAWSVMHTTDKAIRVLVMNGSSSALNLSLTNANPVDNKIVFYTTDAANPTGNYPRSYMSNFCYWHSNTAPTSECLNDPGTVAGQWNVIATVATNGACDGYTFSHVTTGTTYCKLCCKIKPS